MPQQCSTKFNLKSKCTLINIRGAVSAIAPAGFNSPFWRSKNHRFANTRCQNESLDEILIILETQKALICMYTLPKWIFKWFLINFETQKASICMYTLPKWIFEWFFDQFWNPKSTDSLLFVAQMDFWMIFRSILAPKKHRFVAICCQNGFLHDFLINFVTKKAPIRCYLLPKWIFGWFFDQNCHPKSTDSLLFVAKMNFWVSERGQMDQKAHGRTNAGFWGLLCIKCALRARQ